MKRAEYTLKMAQKGLKNLKKSLRGIEHASEVLKRREGDIIITGLGKSGAIAEKIASTMTSLGARAQCLHPVDAIHGDIGMLGSGDVLIAISFSGESKEVTKIVDYAKREFKVPIIALTQSKTSTLGKMADLVIRVPVDEEGSPEGLAPMASTTTTLVLGDMLASSLVQSDYKKDHFARFHPGGSLGLSITEVGKMMKQRTAVPLNKENSKVLDVLSEITKKGLGVSGVVGSKGELVGIITDGDIRRWLLRGGNPKLDKAAKIMTKNPKVISKKDSLRSALLLMEKYKITTLFVTENNKPVGLLHIHDIIGNNVV